MSRLDFWITHQETVVTRELRRWCALESCHSHFAPTGTHHAYCSDACRQAAHRERRKAQAIMPPHSIDCVGVPRGT